MTPYYEDAKAGIQIFHGDNADVLRDFPGEWFDMTFTSPPYNLGNTTGGGFPVGHYSPDAPLQKRGGGGKWQRASASGGLAAGYDGFDDNMPHDEYVAWQKRVLKELWRVTSPHGAIFYNHKPRVLGGTLITPLAYNPDLNVRQIVIWARAGGINYSPTFYVPTHEWIVIFAKEHWGLKSKAASGVGDVWYIPQEASELHPAPFPLALPLRAIETAIPNMVLDPFMGSGTTLRAAKNAGVRAVGIEKSERYCEIAANRLRQECFDFSEAS